MNRLPAMTDEEFAGFIDSKVPDNPAIIKYLITTRNKLKEFKNILVSYSGGSDSDIMLDLCELVKPPTGGQIVYMFFDTGLEWKATKRHVADMSAKYGVEIISQKPMKSIPVACKEYGVPFISKEVSDKIERLQRHGFKFDSIIASPDEVKSGSVWWNESKGKYCVSSHAYLKQYMMRTPPTFMVSSKCCNEAKKKVAHAAVKKYGIDLQMNGQRRAEGGIRSTAYSSCFSPTSKDGCASYRPLFFWSDADKLQYKEWRSIRYSDCYEVWGFQRTGCLGCPCASKAEQELTVAQQYEPNKVKAAYAIFGQSYEYRRKYNEFKEEMKRLKKEGKLCD